ncbi:MAG TPA: glycosyltransferase family 2 protein [Patescibacteria group bacterium]|nr:glycosyltransferase family 2 protein [Patescibacteria group bacterium]
MSGKTLDLSIVILNFNTEALTRVCLQTVFASRLGPYTMEVIVCDNGSTDGSIAMVKNEFPEVILIENKKNAGFAAGNNPGMKRAKGRYILLLNSDTEMPKGTLLAMISFMDENPQAGAATCKVLLPDGNLDPACHRGFPTPWVAFTYVSKLEKLFPKSKIFGEYHQGYKDFSAVHEVDCITGAFFLVRRRVIQEVGLLDEDFFMYGEDIDWAYRIRTKGWKIFYNPAATILHKKKQSGRSNNDKRKQIQTETYFHTYNWLFFKKHYGKKRPVLSFFVSVFYKARLSMLEHLHV